MKKAEMRYCPECGIKSTAGARVLRGEKGVSAATQNEMDRLQEDLRSFKKLAASAIDERDAALEREQALAVQMMNLADALEEAEAPDAEAGDMWDASQCADWIREQSPWAALAKRDLIKQAEALEGVEALIKADARNEMHGYAMHLAARIVSTNVAALRQQVAALTKEVTQ